jgi:hypothetical protein
MKQLSKKVWSHRSAGIGERQYVRDVRSSRPRKISTFQEMVNEIAEISFKNPDLAIFYRGQRREHFVTDRNTSAYPSILRSKPSLGSRLHLHERHRILEKADELLIKEFRKRKIDGLAVLEKFSEVSWAILQHYEICDTPLLDITSSLRLACSFASQPSSKTGVVYVFGFPHTNGSISYYADEELINLRLLNICPPIAMRPHFQEGYLVGTFPTTEIRRRHFKYDVSRRLLAKFKFQSRGFWNRSFHRIPDSALYPQNDGMERIADFIHSSLESWCSDEGYKLDLLPAR